MKTKMMGLTITLFVTLVALTTKAQTVNVDNQMSCSIKGSMQFYTINGACGGPVTVMQGGNSMGIPYTAPSICGGAATTFDLTINRVGGIAITPATASSNGTPVTFGIPMGATCNGQTYGTVYFNGTLASPNFKVY